MRSHLIAIAVAAALLAGRAACDDVVSVAWSTGKAPLTATRFTGTFATGKAYNATAAVIEQSATLSVQLPYPNGCVNHAATSITAAQHECAYAINGGFFDFPPAAACEGALAINGTLLQWPDGASNLTFWGSSRVTQQFHVGYVDDAKHAQSLQLDSLLTGRGWLVRGGAVYVNSSREWAPITPGSKPPSFVTLWAPRTAVGVRADGTAVLVVVDGIEGSSGPNLYEMAELLIQLGVQEAVNFDGGGSSTAVLDGKLFNDAHCADTPVICERNVSSVVCAAYPPASDSEGGRRE